MRFSVETLRFHVNRLLAGREPKVRLSSYPFISGDTFRITSDLILDTEQDIQRVSAEKVQESATVFVAAPHLNALLEKVRNFPKSDSKLIVHNGDEVSATAIVELTQFFSHIFSVNWLDSHPLVTAIPIGLENCHRDWNGQLEFFLPSLRCDRSEPFQSERSITLLCAVNENTNPAKRSGLTEYFNRPELGFQGVSKLARKAYFRKLRNTKFLISPAGNGFDCHRTWEAIYLGAVPIVLRSDWPFSNIDMPVLVVDHWEEAMNLLIANGAEIYQELSTRSAERAYFNFYVKAIFPT